MDTILSILLVEDDINACHEIIAETENHSSSFKLIGFTNTSEKAMEYVLNNMPDIIILDLELHNGGGTGFDVLKGVNTLSADEKPFVLVTTNNISSVSHTIARELGADFIMTKAQEGYSAESVLNFLELTKSVILEKKKPSKNSSVKFGSETTEEQEKRLTRRICNELDKIGVSPRAVGYKYLIDAIKLVIDDKPQNLTIQIGTKYQKSFNSVERAMQNAINQTWSVSDINILLAQYTARIKSEKGVPSITEFVHYYARKIVNSL